MIEAKMKMCNADSKNTVMFLTFLDIAKAYDSISRSRVLNILEGYGVGPKCLRVLKNFWNEQKCTMKQASFFGERALPPRAIITVFFIIFFLMVM